MPNRELARYPMHMPVISSTSVVTVATHARTKLHAQIMSWVSTIYECHLCVAFTSTTVHNLHRFEQPAVEDQ